MEPSYSFEEFVSFLDYASDMGLLKANTVVGWKTAASKVADDLLKQEAEDVRQIDLDLLFQRFVNRNRVQVSPNTLRTYKQRLGKALAEFEQWRQSPTSYKPSLGSRSRTADSGSPKKDVPRSDSNLTAATEGPSLQPKGMLTLPFPLRPDFLVTIQVPRDLTSSEAARIAAFVKTLAVDVEPGP